MGRTGGTHLRLVRVIRFRPTLTPTLCVLLGAILRSAWKDVPRAGAAMTTVNYPQPVQVNGFSCKEGKRKAIPTEVDARVTCTESGGKKVVFTYQQNT